MKPRPPLSHGGPASADAALLVGAQRRSLRITLRLVEEAFREVERLLHEPAYEATMHGMADDPSPHQKQSIADEIGRGREVIGRLRARFDLEPEIHEKSRLVAGKVLTLWEAVMEGRARYLRAYGPVAQGLAEALDPSIERLGDIVRRVHALARPGSVR